MFHKRNGELVMCNKVHYFSYNAHTIFLLVYNWLLFIYDNYAETNIQVNVNGIISHKSKNTICCIHITGRDEKIWDFTITYELE